MTRELIEQLAAIAHRLWRQDLELQGWSFGGRFDQLLRRHDALVDWSELSEQDRRHARLGIECEDLDRLLISCIRYQRGPDREFTLEEMRRGLPVAFVDPEETALNPASRGAVVDWAVDGNGALEMIRVQWDDGDPTEHHPALRELRRIHS